MGWRWQRAFEEVRKGAAPAFATVSNESCPICGHLGRALDRETYRALELGSLATAAFNNVVQANLSAAELLGLPGGRARSPVTTAVPVHTVIQVVPI